MTAPLITVVIPTLNEAHQLCSTLEAIGENSLPHEIIVVDAGSSDSTASIAQSLGARFIQSPKKQRAAQMNTGASMAQSNLLFFIHADTLIPKNAFDLIYNAVIKKKTLGGSFARRFKGDSGCLKITTQLAALRTRATGWALGDQTLFVHKKVFNYLNGFNEWDAFEDLDFSIRLNQLGRTAFINEPIFTSARRFEEKGAASQTLCDLISTAIFLKGYLIHRDYKSSHKTALTQIMH